MQRYTNLRFLRAGGHGTIFVARDTINDQHVAMKRAEVFAHPHDPNDQGVPVTVLREGALLRRLNHPHIVQLYEIFMHENHCYFVFELCSCNLRDMLIELRQDQGLTCMPLNTMRNLFRQILSAVLYCHDRRIVHRDLKPDNILLNATRDFAKVADFGMARAMQFGPDFRYTDRLVTAWYRPPEIILGDAQYGCEIDVWSLGCILVEMMNLSPLFSCNTEIECLLVIFQSFGTPNEEDWPGVTALPNYILQFPRWKPMEVTAALKIPDNSPYRTDHAMLDLASRMLIKTPNRRITTTDALNHPAMQLEPGTGDDHQGNDFDDDQGVQSLEGNEREEVLEGPEGSRGVEIELDRPLDDSISSGPADDETNMDRAIDTMEEAQTCLGFSKAERHGNSELDETNFSQVTSSTPTGSEHSVHTSPSG